MKSLLIAIVAFGVFALSSASYYCPTPRYIKFKPNRGSYYKFRVGDKIEFYCLSGYKLNSKYTTSKCYIYGWAPPVPKCVKIPTCPARARPANGGVSPSKTKYDSGDTITFFCNPGYLLVGHPKVIKCLSNGNWDSDKTPHCKRITCPYRGPPAGGKVSPKQDEYYVNQKVKFTCGADYRLVGKERSTCQNNGKWDSDVPRCQILCFVGKVNQFLSYKPFQKAYLPDDDIKFECRRPYQLVGEKKFVCQDDGTWDPENFPKCVNTCKRPDIPYGGVTVVKDYYLEGEYVRYICNKGFSLSVAKTGRCQDDGKWSATGVCKPIIKKCSGHVIANGGVDPAQKHYNAGDEVEYYCKSGYQFGRGSSSGNKCLGTGKWANSFAVCIEIPHKGSCQHRCGKSDYRRHSCQCDHTCARGYRNNCCDDYEKYCKSHYVIKPRY